MDSIRRDPTSPEEAEPRLDAERGVECHSGLATRFDSLNGRLALLLLAVGLAQAPEARAAEPVAASVSEKITSDVLGPRVIDTAREAGFDVRVTLPAPQLEGSRSMYVVHFGQLHESTDAGLDRVMLRKRAEDFQRRMMVAYPPLLESCRSPIFREGFAAGGLVGPKNAGEANTTIAQHIARVSRITAVSPATIQDDFRALTSARTLARSARRHPNVGELWKHIETARTAIRAYIALDASGGSDAMRLELRKMDFEDATTSLSADSAPSYVASSRLYYEGRATLYPGEISTVNAAAYQAHTDAIKAEERIRDLTSDARAAFGASADGAARRALYERIRALPEPVPDAVARELDTELERLLKAEKEYIAGFLSKTEFPSLMLTIEKARTLVHDARENAVYTRVSEFMTMEPEQAKEMRCAIVEYGIAHTFAESAQAWNAALANPRSDQIRVGFGVIEIRDPDVFSVERR